MKLRYALLVAAVGGALLVASRIGGARGLEVWLAIFGCVCMGFSVAIVVAAAKRMLDRHGGSDVD